MAAILSAAPQRRPEPRHAPSPPLIPAAYSTAFFGRFGKRLRHFGGMLPAKKMVGLAGGSFGSVCIDFGQSRNRV